MWSANLFRNIWFHNLGQHRISHPQWLRRNAAVRCFSHKSSNADASGFPVRYIPKRRQLVDEQQSTHISQKQEIPSTTHSTVFPVDSTQGKMLKTEGPILNHWDVHEKDLTIEQHIKVHNHVVDCMKTGDVVAHNSLTYQNGGLREDIKLSQELCSDGHQKDLTVEQHIKFHTHVVDCMKHGGLREDIKLFEELCSDGLVDEECMEATGEVFEDIQSSNTYFKAKSDKTRQGPILNHWDGHEKDLTVEEHIKVHSHVVDCVKTGEVVAHNSLTYQNGGVREDIKLSQELCGDGLVDEDCMERTEEVFEDIESSDTYFKAKSDKTRQGAQKLAAQFLARRAFTVVELRKKLVAKHFPLNIVEAVVRDFQDRGLINDGLYAETFSHSRWKSSSWGPRRIKQALSPKGVSELNMEKAVKSVFEDSEEGGEESSSVRLSSCSLQQLYIQASKQWQRSRDVAPEKRKARVIRWLQYRGFDWGVIGTVIKKLESDNPGGILP